MEKDCRGRRSAPAAPDETRSAFRLGFSAKIPGRGPDPAFETRNHASAGKLFRLPSRSRKPSESPLTPRAVRATPPDREFPRTTGPPPCRSPGSAEDGNQRTASRKDRKSVV